MAASPSHYQALQDNAHGSALAGYVMFQQPPATPKRAAHYLWAVLIARILEVFPLLCLCRGRHLRINALITHSTDIRNILDHIGAESVPPHIAPVCGLCSRLPCGLFGIPAGQTLSLLASWMEFQLICFLGNGNVCTFFWSASIPLDVDSLANLYWFAEGHYLAIKTI